MSSLGYKAVSLFSNDHRLFKYKDIINPSFYILELEIPEDAIIVDVKWSAKKRTNKVKPISVIVPKPKGYYTYYLWQYDGLIFTKDRFEKEYPSKDYYFLSRYCYKFGKAPLRYDLEKITEVNDNHHEFDKNPFTACGAGISFFTDYAAAVYFAEENEIRSIYCL